MDIEAKISCHWALVIMVGHWDAASLQITQNCLELLLS